jgi:hypothetical protein
MPRLRVGALPGEPLAAAARFHAEDMPRALAALAQGGDLVLVFAPADHTHRDWRLAAVRGLARAHAPARVNAVAGDDEAALAAACAYLERAPGVTGQLLPTDGTGAGPMLYRNG